MRSSFKLSAGPPWKTCALLVCLLIGDSCGQTGDQTGKVRSLERVPTRLASTSIPAKSTSIPVPKGVLDVEIATPEMVAWLEQMIRSNLPETYEDTRNWDQQKEVWDGVKVWREGNHLETKRKKKTVNSGTWTRYAIAIVEPEKNLHIQFHRLEPLPDGKIAFAVTVDCALDVFGRLSQWARDVQVFSISANADAACRLTLEGTVALQMNLLKLPPDVTIKPVVSRAHVALTYYNVRRISQIGGELAQTLGKGLRRTLDEKLEDTNRSLADKINAQLAKKSDRMTFSTQQWLQTKLPLPGKPATATQQ
jgi:hypothetical protein